MSDEDEKQEQEYLKKKQDILKDLEGVDAKRIFYFNFPERFKGTSYPIPARNLAVVVYPPEAPDAPPIIPMQRGENGKALIYTRNGTHDEENWWGWYPQWKPGLESPWDGTTWGKLPNPIPENFRSIYVDWTKGNGWPFCKNELFPIIKKARALFGRDFFGFGLFYGVKLESGKMYDFDGVDYYTLAGDFQIGFEDRPVVDL
jgi:hypothetical protein